MLIMEDSDPESPDASADGLLDEYNGVHSNQQDKKMHLIGHRGASESAPENTMEAMKLAFQQGARGIEFDIQVSKDGQVFLLHDNTLLRTASKKCPDKLQADGMSQEAYVQLLGQDVSTLDYDAFIKHVDVGSWKGSCFSGARASLMTEVMAAIPAGSYALCEIKGGDLAAAEAVTRLVRDQGWGADVLSFIGFDLSVMAETKRLLTEYGLAAMRVFIVKDVNSEEEAFQVIAQAQTNSLDGIDFQADLAIVTETVVAASRAAGLQIGVWVWDELPDSDTASTVDGFVELGIDFFTSNMPEPVHQLAFFSKVAEATQCWLEAQSTCEAVARTEVCVEA